MDSLTRALDECAVAALSSMTGERADTRVGLDLTRIADVRDSIEVFGDSYLSRVYTPGELADCGLNPGRLAARFAAKEAVTKVLAPDDAPGWWRDIETVRTPEGACALALRGAAAEHADDAGLAHWSLSLTHEGDYAAAVVFAQATRTHQKRSPQEAEA